MIRADAASQQSTVANQPVVLIENAASHVPAGHVAAGAASL